MHVRFPQSSWHAFRSATHDTSPHMFRKLLEYQSCPLRVLYVKEKSVRYYKFSGLHSACCSNCGLLDSYTMYFYKFLPVLWRNVAASIIMVTIFGSGRFQVIINLHVQRDMVTSVSGHEEST